MKTRVGLLGCGSIALWFHLKILHQHLDVELVSVAEPDTDYDPTLNDANRERYAQDP